MPAILRLPTTWPTRPFDDYRRREVVALGRVIQLKRAAGRPTDLEAIAEFELLLTERERDNRGD